MKKLKKNNKGFSLVELIVVVLIMGIIAVALAPQVMKWVSTARTNTDDNQKATIKSVAQTAVAEYMSEKSLSSGSAYYKVDNTDSKVVSVDASGSGVTDSNNARLTGGAAGLADLMTSLLGDFPKPQSGDYYEIKVDGTGKVEVNIK